MDPADREAAPSVATVVLNWNGASDTLACLASLDRLSYPSHQVIVVDNGSTDDSVDRLRRERPDLALIETGENLGFAGGNNVGIRNALERDAEFVWLLNNDTEVEPGALTALVDVARSTRDIGLVGSRLLDARDPEQVQAWGGGSIRWWLGVPREHRRRRPSARLDYIIGASMLVRHSVFESIGFLDDAFFFYWEDADFGVRARRAGWRLAVAPGSVVHHKGGGTASDGAQHPSLAAERMHMRSLVRFMKKHHRVWPVPLLVRATLEVGIQIRRRRPARFFSLWRTLIESTLARGV